MDADNGAFRSPAPSSASRLPPKPSENQRFSGRVRFVAGLDPHVVHCESILEWKAALVLLAMPDALDIFEQPPAVEYVDQHGEIHHHTFDFMLHLRDGTRLAIMVKPAEIAARKGIYDLVKLIALQVSMDFADGVLLITDEDCDRDTVHDAVLIDDMRRHDDPEADAAVRGIVADLVGEPTIQCLVDATGLGPRAFGAVVRLIGDGVLQVMNSRRIRHGARVRRTGAPFRDSPP
ncbi:hypothetical protein [Rhodoblastus acidophilus]|uniref:hypothetical protein n=1 Tax=Rhodoblastus acidophilus TaxID=1074 RepID=UPI000B4FDEDF|nr:hypothetical protein [Rhodoblastus acidophilus]PPQ39558.1 hypothetical protein CKO16_04765 [Rhodoblastus acidophilus]RAI24341.1 hypothetical protein CH337_00145 [Rhodoblastus acidophilus]